jgi:hypothetical protein
MAHLGWIIAPKTKSCSAACADQASICHEASLQDVNSLAEFKFALGQSGNDDVASAINDQHLCFFPEPINPSVVFPLASRSVQYNGASSTCEAVPTGDQQRLCCCSPAGCATSGM